MSLRYLIAAALLKASLALAATAQSFQPPSISPFHQSLNYTGQSNGSLPISDVKPGLVFDRFVQVWFENTDFATANSTTEFRALADRGILLTSYYSTTHPSQPNYMATIGGSFWGSADDDSHDIPQEVGTMVDLLELGNVSWAAYMENMPTDGFTGTSFSSRNYVTPGASDYAYYMRKHNPPILYDSVKNVHERAARVRNFNDFALDVNASALPQWMFVTPNMVNDAHDTTIDFAASFLTYFLEPLLSDPRFNDNKTLILVTFDENENYDINNNVFAVLLGGAVPEELRGTVDTTYYTHYSAMSSVQANWGLGSLGRGDTDPIMSNVYSLVADASGYKNNNVSGDAIPATNVHGTIPGPLNTDYPTDWPAPNTSAVGAGGGPVFVG
ncbi:hypothetical protein PENSPDRAFT_692533 [Peniophora sp. CONT]|nr:hypothetical protein PENSPDRAFT_692533 [Peniophora sp. CONT]